jgi:hypothetical protein
LLQNALAYNIAVIITVVKMFSVQAPVLDQKSFGKIIILISIIFDVYIDCRIRVLSSMNTIEKHQLPTCP